MILTWYRSFANFRRLLGAPAELFWKELLSPVLQRALPPELGRQNPQEK
jgi:hypothetical protein